ncbi:MAG: dipeptidase [Candidatus Eremiobacteraeota bacterium]|nr:dipeptidase [Candidatus Eremiobacteraeota bacterium]
MNATDSIDRYLEENHSRFVDELRHWVAIPSLSADPARAGDLRRCAERIVDHMRTIGLQAELLQTHGNPVAYGERIESPAAPTLLIYGHYDVQPADPIELWHSPPFEATVRDGKIFGRGVVDDKGQVLAHLAALEAHLRARGRLPINVKVVVEGEEEIGSPNFEPFLEENNERLKSDVAVISDTAMFAENVPSLTTSLRGIVHWEVRVDGPATDVHSGTFGGIVRNPIEALAKIIARLKDASDRVVGPGFYDGVQPLTADQRNALQQLPFDEADYKSQLGVRAFRGERDCLALERLWYRPTLECNGIWGGYQGPGSKTIVPAHACAKISARLVGDQEPAKIKQIVADFIRTNAPDGVVVHVESYGDVRAVRTSHDHPAVKAAARAVEAGFGKAPCLIGSGGTIGPVSSFDRILKLPQVLIGVGLPDDAIHAPNEKFNLEHFFAGMKTMARFYDELASARA